MTITLTQRGRTWAAAAGAFAVAAGMMGAALAASGPHVDRSLTAEVNRFVDAVNARDWHALSLSASDQCQAFVEAAARDMSDGALLGSRAWVVAVDEAKGTTTVGIDYPTLGAYNQIQVSVWTHADGRWIAHTDTCDPDVAPSVTALLVAWGNRNVDASGATVYGPTVKA